MTKKEESTKIDKHKDKRTPGVVEVPKEGRARSAVFFTSAEFLDMLTQERARAPATPLAK